MKWTTLTFASLLVASMAVAPTGQARAAEAGASQKGSPGHVPGLPEPMRLTVNPSDEAAFDAGQLPPGVALSFIVEPFRQRPKLLDKAPFVKRFAQQFDCEGYRKAEEDEFFNREYIDTWRANIRQAMETLPDPSGHEMTVPVAVEFGEYDFDRGGFPVTSVQREVAAGDVAVPGCFDDFYEGDTKMVVTAEEIYVSTLIPSDWRPLLKTPKEKARRIVNNTDGRIASGTMTVTTTGIKRASKHPRQRVEAEVRKPFTVSLTGPVDAEWTLEPPEVASIDGHACDTSPTTTRFRVNGADGLPYVGSRRSCKLAGNGRDYTGPASFEPAPVDAGIPFSQYRLGLLWLDQKPSLLEEPRDQGLYRQIVEDHKESYRGDAMYGSGGFAIKPHIEQSELDMDASDVKRDVAELAGDLREYLRNAASDMPSRFVGARELDSVEVDVQSGTIRLSDGSLWPGEQQEDGLIHYNLAALDGHIYHPDVESTGPEWEGLPALTRLELRRNLELGELQVSAEKAERLAQLKDCCGHPRALFSFRVDSIREAVEAPVAVGELAGVYLVFPPRDHNKWLRATESVDAAYAEAERTVELAPSHFAELETRVPPLKVEGILPASSSSMNPIEETQYMSVRFDRPIRLTEAGQSGDAIRVGCNSLDTPDMEPLPSQAKVVGSTLTLRATKEAEVPKYASVCEFRVGPEAVRGTQKGAAPAERIEHRFDVQKTDVALKRFASVDPDEGGQDLRIIVPESDSGALTSWEDLRYKQTCIVHPAEPATEELARLINYGYVGAFEAGSTYECISSLQSGDVDFLLRRASRDGDWQDFIEDEPITALLFPGGGAPPKKSSVASNEDSADDEQRESSLEVFMKTGGVRVGDSMNIPVTIRFDDPIEPIEDQSVDDVLEVSCAGDPVPYKAELSGGTISVEVTDLESLPDDVQCQAVLPPGSVMPKGGGVPHGKEVAYEFDL